MASKFGKLIRIEPLATLASANVLGDSIVAGAAYASGWSGKAVVFITLIWHNLVNVVGTLFARAAVTPNDHVTDQANAQATTILGQLGALQAQDIDLNAGPAAG